MGEKATILYSQTKNLATRQFMLKKLKSILHRRRAKIRGKKFKRASQVLRDEGYYSQCGQDKFVHEVLYPHKKDGIFVDIGANDGVTLSNTYFFEKAGWTGLAVEPIPAAFEKLCANRQCAVVQGCVGEMPGKVKFRAIEGYSEMLSGIVDEYDAKHAERIQKEIKEKGGSYEDIEINCHTLADLLQEHDINSVDYMSIDVEGAELSILKGIDFDKVEIQAISVENSYANDHIQHFLASKGFKLSCIVGDEFYIKQ